MVDTVKQVATLANLIEIGKRALLRQQSPAIQIPQENDRHHTRVKLGERVAEDFAAALLRAIKEKEALTGGNHD